MLLHWLAVLACAGETTVSMDGHAWADLRAAADVAQTQAAERRRGPGPWVSRRDVVVSDLGDTLQVDATWIVSAMAPGRFDALLASGLVVGAVTVDGVPWGPSLGADRAPVEHLHVSVSRRAEIRLTGFVPKGVSGDVTFELLPGAGGVQLPPGLILADDRHTAVPIGARWLTADRALHVTPGHLASDPDTTVLFTARVAVGVTVGDGEVAVRARVTWSVRRGRARSVTLQVPGGTRDLKLTGAELASFTRSGDRIEVLLREPTDRAVTLELAWTESVAAGDMATVPLPDVSPLGALSVERVLSVARDTDVEVVPRFDRGEALAIEAVPAWAGGLISGTPTAARRGDVVGRIDLLRFTPADRPPMVVDVAEWFVAASGDGRAIAQGTLTVRNERASSLRVSLRPGMRLLAVQVEGQPIAPIADPDGWRIPLPRSVETMRGLLSFPVELTVLSVDGAAWRDGGEASVALPGIGAEVAVRRVTLNLPRAVRPRVDAGGAGRVAAFSEGEGLAYGFAEGVDQARASALYQDALGSWMKNDFRAAQEKIDALRQIGADNENVTRLQSNLDLVGGEVSAPGDEALARRLKDQARARSLDEEQQQEEMLRYADEQLAAGNDAQAAMAYAAAAETADKLAQLEQSESQDQRLIAREAKKKEAEATTREARGLGASAAAGDGAGLGGLGVRGMGQGGGGSSDASIGAWAESDGEFVGQGFVGGTLGGQIDLGAASGHLHGSNARAVEEPASPPPTTGMTRDTLSPMQVPEPEEDVAYRNDSDDAGRSYEGVVETSAGVVVSGRGQSRRATSVARPARGRKANAPVAPAAPARPVVQFEIASDVIEGALARPEGASASAPAPTPSPADRPRPVDGWAPLEVTATAAAVVVPALGETVRFQHLLLPPGADVPVTVRVDLPRRFR